MKEIKSFSHQNKQIKQDLMALVNESFQYPKETQLIDSSEESIKKLKTVT